MRGLVPSHLLLLETRLPPHRADIGLHHVPGMASHTAIVGLSGAGGHQFSVCRAASGANPFRGRSGIAHLLCRSSSGGQLLQGPADELRRLSRSTCREGRAHGVVRGRYPIAQAHQGLDRIL